MGRKGRLAYVSRVDVVPPTLVRIFVVIEDLNIINLHETISRGPVIQRHRHCEGRKYTIFQSKSESELKVGDREEELWSNGGEKLINKNRSLC